MEVGDWVITAGDCQDRMDAMAPGTVDLVFCDPPYNIDYDYEDCDDSKPADVYQAWCGAWLDSVHRVLSPAGSFWLAIGDEYVSELDVLAKTLGFHKRSHVVWYYTFGVNCSKNFARSHTHLLYYTKHPKKFTFNYKEPAVRVPSARQLIYKDPRANSAGKLPDNTWVLHRDDLATMFDRGEDTWLESRVAGTFSEREDRGTHGEVRGCPQMPLAVMDRIILASSNPGDLVLDPMSGTGSTGASAIALGRDFAGFEKCETYVERIKQRLSAIKTREAG